MSGDIIKGRTSRKIMTIMAAIFAVAMMLAVPLVVAVDSDADLTGAEAGFSATIKNPETDQMPLDVKANKILAILMHELSIFNVTIFTDVTATEDPMTVTSSWGEKVTSNTKTSIMVDEVSTNRILITIKATDDGTLINPLLEYMPAEYKAAANAIKELFGDEVSNGDVVWISGSLNVRLAEQDETTYKLLEGNKCVPSKEVSSMYAVKNFDLTVAFKHGSEDLKSVKLFANYKGMAGNEDIYEYASDNVTVGTSYKAKNTVSFINTGEMYYSVGEKNYTMVYEPTSSGETPHTVSEQWIDNQADINVSDVEAAIAALPAATDNITVDKTYSAAQSAFDGVVMDAVGNDLLNLILIIVGVVIGVIVLIVILIIVLVVLKKKKKQ